MAWSKITKKTATASAGFLSGQGFLVEPFLSAGTDWSKVAKPTDTWTKKTKATE